MAGSSLRAAYGRLPAILPVALRLAMNQRPTQRPTGPETRPAETPVSRRRVFYVFGFDPRGSRWYHRLFRREAAKYRNGKDFRIAPVGKPEEGGNQLTWTIEAEEGGQRVETSYSILEWDDIISANWPSGNWRMLKITFSNLFIYLRNGTISRTLRASYPAFFCGIIPSAFTIALFLASLALAAITGWLLSLALPGYVALAPAAIVLALAIVKGLNILDRRFRIHWLNRVYYFNVEQAERRVPGLEERVRRFGEIVADAHEEGEADEILIVGHSTGCQLAVSVVAEAIRQLKTRGETSPRLSFLTLGSGANMLSWHPASGWFHEDLATAAFEPGVHWIDFSIASDGACYAMSDPLHAAGIAQKEGAEPSPKLLNVRLFKLLPPDKLKSLEKNRLLLHFQYLMAPEIAGEYDFFRITCGARTLRARYAERAPVTNFTKTQFAMFRGRDQR